jgi:nicotinate phosphoribosyltransferase
LLIDTYDTEVGARKVVALAPKLKTMGAKLAGVRLDSGDLDALSRSVRRILDDGGLADVRILASGGLDEDDLAGFVRSGAPIDGYGIGTSLTTSADAPSLDCAYKLEEYAGLARRKRSSGKATWPGRKQVWRRYDVSGRMAGDTISLENDPQGGVPLLAPAMRGGRRLRSPSLAEARHRAAADLARLPEAVRRLDAPGAYPVEIAPALHALADDVDRWLAARPGEG